jgi:TatD DNase family protein
MIIDTHCHFDMMPNPELYLKSQEAMTNISIGMTNLPSHFVMGHEHVKTYRYARLALGLHPLYASEKKSELRLFSQYINQTSYIGEIGLDFSNEGLPTKEDQLVVLESILPQLTGKKKIVSVHSRRAEKVLFEMLCKHEIKNVIFHWYSGPLTLIPQIVERGYYFSINEKMTKTDSGKKIIGCIPSDRILTETDAPYNHVCSIKQALLNIGLSEDKVYENFQRLLTSIR